MLFGKVVKIENCAACHDQSWWLCYMWIHVERPLNINTLPIEQHFLFAFCNTSRSPRGATMQEYIFGHLRPNVSRLWRPDAVRAEPCIYPSLFTKPEGDNCLSIYQIRWIKTLLQFVPLKLLWNDPPFFSPFTKQWISSYGSQSKCAKIATTDLVNINNIYFIEILQEIIITLNSSILFWQQNLPNLPNNGFFVFHFPAMWLVSSKKP